MFLLLIFAALQATVEPLRLYDAGCRPGTAHPVIVRVSGFSNRQGQVRVRLFGGATSTYFDRKKALVRTEVAVPKSGSVEICLPAPRPGTYAVDVRHDVNGNGDTDRQDGGGSSGNPRVGLMDVILGRKPEPRTVQFAVGAGGATVPVTLLYLRGGSFKPVAAAD